MKINLSPVRRDDAVTISKSSDTLTVNDISYDFSVIPNGATLPASAVDCEWIVGDISRIDGELSITLILPHGPNPREDQAFPKAIENIPDGDVILPQNTIVETVEEPVEESSEEAKHV